MIKISFEYEKVNIHGSMPNGIVFEDDRQLYSWNGVGNENIIIKDHNILLDQKVIELRIDDKLIATIIPMSHSKESRVVNFCAINTNVSKGYCRSTVLLFR